MERNIKNNPTGKPYCCKIGCDKDAVWQLWYGKTPDDHTQSCNEHIAELVGDVTEFSAEAIL